MRSGDEPVIRNLKVDGFTQCLGRNGETKLIKVRKSGTGGRIDQTKREKFNREVHGLYEKIEFKLHRIG